MADITETLRQRYLRFRSRFDSYYRCPRCRLSLRYREPKWIRYHRDGSKTSPLCKQCFDEVDCVIASRYFHYVWSEVWGRSSTDDEFRGCYRTFMQYAIFDALERSKDPMEGSNSAMEMREWAPSMTLAEAKEVLEGRVE